MTFLPYGGRTYAAFQARPHSAPDRTEGHGLGQRRTRSSEVRSRAVHPKRQDAVAAIVDLTTLLEWSDGGSKCEASDKAQLNQPPAPRPTAVL